jgi:hypothetical protein
MTVVIRIWARYFLSPAVRRVSFNKAGTLKFIDGVCSDSAILRPRSTTRGQFITGLGRKEAGRHPPRGTLESEFLSIFSNAAFK